MNAADERARLLRSKLASDKLLTAEVAAQLEVPWRTNGVIVQCVFFFLTCIAIGAFYGLCSVLDVPKAGIVLGIAAIAAAEMLIRIARWFSTGVEIALWLGGLGGFITELPRTGSKESILVFAAACAIAGWRVRNPIAGACSAILVMVWFEQRFDLGVIAGLAMATLAMFALLRTWQRPTTEWLLIAITVALPVAAWFTADERWRVVTLTLYAAFGAVALVLAFAKRHHAFFVAALEGLGFAAFDVARRIVAPEEAKLAIAGAVLLGAAFVLSRALKGKTHGLVATKTGDDESLAMLATLAAAPHTAAPSSSAPATGDGRFGGAGASGGY